MRKKTIFRRITVSFLLMQALLFCLLGSGLLFLSEHQIKETIVTQQNAFVAQLADQIQIQFEPARQQLEMIARRITPRQIAYPDEAQKLLDDENDAKIVFSGGLLLFSPQGKLLAESPFLPHRRGMDYSFRQYVTRAISERQPVVSDPYRAIVPPYHEVLTYSVPVSDESGKLIGVLAGRHDLEQDSILSQIEKLRIGRTGYAYIFSEKRLLVVHKDSRRRLEYIKPGMNQAIDLALEKGFEGGIENVNSKGIRGLTVIKRMPKIGWYLALHYPLTEAYQPLRELRFILVSAFVASAILTVLLTIWNASRIASPINEFTRHLQKVGALPLEERLVKVSSSDEIGIMGNAFNEMIAELAHSQGCLAKNEEIYRTIVEFSSEVILWRGARLETLYVSPNCRSMFGFSDTELYHDPSLLDKAIVDEDRLLWDNHTKENIEHYPFDIRVRTSDGTERILQHFCVSVNDKEGVFRGYRGSFLDVTATRQLQQQVTETKLFLEALLNQAMVPTFVLGPDHRVRYWNRACEALTGSSAAEMIGTSNQWMPFYVKTRPTLADLVIDNAMDHVNEFYASYCFLDRSRSVVQAEGWYPNLGGADRYIYFEASPVYDGQGRLLCVVEMLHDITRRKLLEEKLALFMEAVEQSASSIIITSTSGAIEYVNRRFCEVTGYGREEAIGQNPRILKSGDQAPEVYAELWRTITNGKSWHGEFHNRRKNGSCFWESTTIAPILDSHGNITRFLAVKDDITKRKETERELNKKQAELEVQHEQLKNLFQQVEKGKREWEQTLDCIADLVMISDEQGVVRRCNGAVWSFTGKTHQETIGRPWRELLLPEMDAAMLGPQGGELHHLPSDRWFVLTIYPYSPSGVPAGEVVTMHDLTDIKRVGQELERAYEELKAAQVQLLQREKMASVGQLAAGVAHEINNPMGFISSNLSTLGKYTERLAGFIAAQDSIIAGSVPDRAELETMRKKLKVDYIVDDTGKLIKESLDGAERVKVIVQNLKSFSRVDETESKTSDLNECLESTITIAWNELKYRAELLRNYGELPLVYCNPQQLNQVFLNLLINAAHAVEKNGRMGKITVSSRTAGDWIEVLIEDNGCGIPPEVQGRIFEPFFTTKEPGKGTGLGLSISYEIVKKHGGEIIVASTVGEGSLFTVRIPLKLPERDRQESSHV